MDVAAKRGVGVHLAADRTYVLNRSLDLPSGTRITGEGASSVLRFTWRVNDQDHDGYYLGNRDQVGPGNADITLRDFAIRGAGSGLPAGENHTHTNPRVPAIRLRLVDRFVISGLDISYAPGISLIHQGCSDGLISDNRIHHSGRDGINSTWHVENMHDVRIEGNRISKVGDDGIAVIGTPGERANGDALPYRVLIKNNVIRGWRSDPNGQLLGRGITVMASTGIGLVGNRIDRTHSAGILVAPSTRSFSVDPATGEPWRSSDINITGNVVLGGGRTHEPVAGAEDDDGRGGVIVKQTDRLSLMDNRIQGSRGQDVALYDCRSCVRQGNS